MSRYLLHCNAGNNSLERNMTLCLAATSTNHQIEYVINDKFDVSSFDNDEFPLVSDFDNEVGYLITNSFGDIIDMGNNSGHYVVDKIEKTEDNNYKTSFSYRRDITHTDFYKTIIFCPSTQDVFIGNLCVSHSWSKTVKDRDLIGSEMRLVSHKSNGKIEKILTTKNFVSEYMTSFDMVDCVTINAEDFNILHVKKDAYVIITAQTMYDGIEYIKDLITEDLDDDKELLEDMLKFMYDTFGYDKPEWFV